MNIDPNLELINERVNDRILVRCTNFSLQIGDDGQESTPAPCEIGHDYKVKGVSFTNVHGGTEIVRLDATVRTVARFWDYETGWNFAGRITEIRGSARSIFSNRSVQVPGCVQFSQHNLG